jgi:hypothetical protein
MTVVLVILAVGLVLVSLGAIGAVLFMRTREQKRDLVLQSAEALATLDDALDEAVKELNKLGLMVQKEIAEKYNAIQFLYNMVEEKEKIREQGGMEFAPLMDAVDDVRLADVRLEDESDLIDEATSKDELLLPKDEPVLSDEAASVDEPTSTDNESALIDDEPIPEAEPVFSDEAASVDALTPTDEPIIFKEPPAPLPAPAKKKRGRPKKATTAAKPATVTPKRGANPKHKRVMELHASGMDISDIAKEMNIGQGEATLILETASKRGVR